MLLMDIEILEIEPIFDENPQLASKISVSIERPYNFTYLEDDIYLVWRPSRSLDFPSLSSFNNLSYWFSLDLTSISADLSWRTLIFSLKFTYILTSRFISEISLGDFSRRFPIIFPVDLLSGWRLFFACRFISKIPDIFA